MSIEGNRKKFFIYTIIVVTFASIVLGFSSFNNFVLKSIVSSYFRQGDTKLSWDDFKLSLNQIDLKKFVINDKFNSLSSDSVAIKFSFWDLLYKRKTNFQIKTDGLNLNNLKNLILEISGEYNHRNGSIKIEPKIVSENFSKKLEFVGKIEFINNILSIKSAHVKIDNGFLDFSSDILIKNSKIKSIAAKFNAKDLPLDLYKILLSSDNPTYKFLEESIFGGKIDSADLNIDLNTKQIESLNLKDLQETITDQCFFGKVIISGIEYKYSPYMPNVKAKILPLLIEGRNVSIDAKDIEVADNIITEGKISFDTLSDVFEVIVEAKAVGKVGGLIKFIEPESLTSMKNSNIDLAKVKGNVVSIINLRIPTKKELPNYYNVKSKITDLDLHILNNMIKLNKYSIDAELLDNKITINGKGKVNNFDSKTNFIVNLKNKEEFSHKLESEIIVTKSQNELPGIDFLDGRSKILITMLSKNGVTNLIAKSNLSESEFLIPNLSLNKAIGKKANFELKGVVVEGDKQELSIKLEGEDSLKISGKIFTQKSFNKIAFNEVKYLNNDFSAEIITKDKDLYANISGALIDLSNADFSSFLNSKKKETNSLKININLEKIKLKNGIDFTETMITSICKKGICPVARFYSSINNKDYVYAEYKNETKPKWIMETNVLGKFLAGLGVSNKVKNGVLNIEMSAPLTSDVLGHKSEGNLTIYNMSVSNSKFLTKMISFISIPGLLGALTNQDIHFDKITSSIIFENNVIRLKDTSAIGQEFNFFSKGYIDLNTKVIDVKGQVVPSLYGLNQLIGSLPLLKYLFGKRGGLVFTPFFYKDKF